MIFQLDPPIPLIAKGQKCLAHLVIDYGVEFDLMWVVFTEDGECWCVPNPDVRAQENWSVKRKKNSTV